MHARRAARSVSAVALAGGLSLGLGLSAPTASAKPVRGDGGLSLGALCTQAVRGLDTKPTATVTLEALPGLRCGQVFGKATARGLTKAHLDKARHAMKGAEEDATSDAGDAEASDSTSEETEKQEYAARHHAERHRWANHRDGDGDEQWTDDGDDADGWGDDSESDEADRWRDDSGDGEHADGWSDDSDGDRTEDHGYDGGDHDGH